MTTSWPRGHYGCYHCGHDQTEHNGMVGCPHCKCMATVGEAGTDPTGKYADVRPRAAHEPPLHDWQRPDPPPPLSRLNYSINAEAWWAAANDAALPAGRKVSDELRIGRDSYTADGHDDGCCWEFYVRIHRFGPHNGAPGASTALRIEMYDDAWAALTECPALFARLAAMSNHEVSVPRREWTLADVVKVLDELGFTDDTPRTH